MLCYVTLGLVARKATIDATGLMDEKVWNFAGKKNWGCEQRKHLNTVVVKRGNMNTEDGQKEEASMLEL